MYKMLRVSPSVAILFLSVVLEAQVSWERVYEGILSNDTLPGFYCGGFERNKHNLCDIDADGDLDFFIGMWDGTIMFYENRGDAAHPRFKFITEKFGNINVRGAMSKGYAAPEFVDIDADSDYDCFVGDYIGKVHFYKNVGTPQAWSFVLIDTHMFSPILWRHANLAFCDIDNDGDYDMWVGAEDGRNGYYPNIGTVDSFCFDSLATEWFCTSPAYQQIDPTFCDIDNDNDYDLFYGELKGRMVYWRNEGDSASYNFPSITNDSLPLAVVYDRSGGTFADIDGDGDFDLFFGAKDGLNRFYKNIGTADSAVFELVTEHYLYIDFDMYSCPTFVDIDGDKDMDMFVGIDDIRTITLGITNYGKIRLCRNVGDTLAPAWVYETKEFSWIGTSPTPAPAFVDIDRDKDMDLFVGTSEGKLYFYCNMGNPSTPSMWFITDNFANIDVGGYSKPAFGDIDCDGDYDLFIGNAVGKILYFKNKGSPTTPNFDSLPDTCIDSGGTYAAPALGDVDMDGDLDMIVGFGGGYLRFYKNEGDSAIPVWVVADTSIYDTMNVHRLSTPALTDIDGDGDLDLFVGEGDGGINFWRSKLIGVEENVSLKVQESKSLKVYPNPFSSVVRIKYQGVSEKVICLKIYDLGGRVVRTFNNLTNQPFNQIVWDGTGNSGESVPRGIYFCRLWVGDWTSTKKLIRIR